VSVAGVVALVVSSLLIANHPATQQLFTTHVPLFTRLEPSVIDAVSLGWAVVLSVLVIGGSLLPLYRPQPSRLLDTVLYAQKRVIVGGLGLATFGYFQWSHRLPRATLTMTVGLLVLTVPLWFVWIRRRPTVEAGRTLVVGDDLEQIERIVPTIESTVVGYLCPSLTAPDRTAVADGGVSISENEGTNEGAVGRDQANGRKSLESISRLGGLSRLNDILIEHDIDTVVLAFRQADRGDFFGALDVCHNHGVNAKVHRDYADDVLTSSGDVGTLANVDVEPWDLQDYVFKRLFDVTIAGGFLLLISPVALVIMIALAMEGKGPIFFTQKRTYLFGDVFLIRKFRTLVPVEGGEVGTEIESHRQTKLGQVLRTTHLDEIPQLWSILVGDMSVVGPRPAQTEIESDFEQEAVDWRKRWFVKPGLTGLAQINNATSQEPQEKIRYDLQYIQNQSLTFDLMILIRQLWAVIVDTTSLVQRDESIEK